MIIAQWLSHLDLRLHGTGQWITLGPLIYQSAVFGGTITVPKDLVSDLASVPRVPFAYLLAGSRVPGPAVLHDFLYLHPEFDDRALADELLYEAMGVAAPELGFEPEHPVIRSLIYAGVRAGGWVAWRDHRRAAALNPEWSQRGWPEAP